MRDKLYKNLYKKLADKYKLPVEVIEKITDSEFEFAKTIISEGKDEPIRLQYLGLFRVKPGRRELVQKRRSMIRANIHEKSRQAEQRDDLQGRGETQQDSLE